MAVSSTLTGELKKVVLSLEDDLRERVLSQPEVLEAWQAEHRSALARERTAMSWQEWRDDRVTQAAVAWVLTTVFIRFCEDNRLLKPVWFAGPPQRRQEALDAELAYFRANPEHTDREWILTAVEHLRQVRATADLVESHSPLWTVAPSGPAARELVHFWRAKGDDGELLRDFTDPELSTRFLGDLYQDLSDYAKKTYALLQTPEFVEEFILDQTMEPALAERPLEDFTIIDPTCGSGHFLLGAFQRLVDRWADHAPGLNARARVAKALESIHGVDINPFAVAIAKFRLIVAAMQAAEEATLEEAPNFRLNLGAGDSLLHGQHQQSFEFEGFDADAAISGFAYATEDLHLLKKTLQPGRYDVVVGNPPYITVKDKALNSTYRDLYTSCKGPYALTVPFMERFFELAKPATGDHPAGWTGQITSNSFMKREFGSKVIEEYLVKQDLRAVIDTSGAYIPGHGTPTVIIVGRNQRPAGTSIKAVLGVRGEPGQPQDPARGFVWSEIVDHVDSPDFDGNYVTVTNLDRVALSTHPWSLSGGGANQVLAVLESVRGRLAERVSVIGRTTHTGNDEAFFVPAVSVNTLSIVDDTVPVVLGEEVRDFNLQPKRRTILPYDAEGAPRDISVHGERHLWRVRRSLETQLDFGHTKYERGLRWIDHSMFFPERYSEPLSIAFAEVATHNHFVLDRGGKVFKQTAPAIKLPREATESEHLALLGVLNSSTACFWLKQNCHNKGDSTDSNGARVTGDPAFDTYQFNGANVKDLPLPSELPTERGAALDALAGDLESIRAEIATNYPPTGQRLAHVNERSVSLRERMMAHQEELDWEVYRLYGLVDEDDLTYTGDDMPEVSLGERAFEIALARRVAAGDEVTAWFERHGSTPVTEIPTHWPQAYRDLVQRRLDLIESNKFIRLLEKPEYKRRWAMEPWGKQVESALRGWLLDRLEDRKYWFDASGQRPQPRSVAQLADLVSRDSDFVSVLELWAGTKDQPVARSLSTLLSTESVPFLAAYRLKDSGLRKQEAWEHTWDLQRREDAGERLDVPIPVPPKYTTADFRKQQWWMHRGKLDVPKERFILYPHAGRDTDPTDVLGWAGWNHAQQSLALATLVGEREADGWADDRLVPLVAGLAELQPWVQQWHDEPDPTYGVNLAEFCSEELRDRAAQVGHTLDQLHAWRPAPSTRGRKKKANP